MQKIKELVQSINEKNSNMVCEKIAKILMQSYCLKVANQKFYFAEIEFYLHSDQHPDPYVHQNDKQLDFWKFYVHPKDGNYGGIDITIGDKLKNLYGGVLIRGVKSKNGQFFSGPNLFKKEIYRLLKVDNFESLQNIIDQDVKIVDCDDQKGSENFFRSTRVGLRPKYEDYCEDGRYIYKLHRFIAFPDEKEHSYKEKKNALDYSAKKRKP